MKCIKFLAGAMLCSAMAVTSCTINPTANVKLTNRVDSVSYALGQSWGEAMASQLQQMPGGPFNRSAIISGIMNSCMEDGKAIMSSEQAMALIDAYFMDIQNKEAEAAAEKNKAILEENMKKGGFLQTASGLQYKVITQGYGETPTDTDKVRVHYTGKLADGTVFDSSVERGEPTEFPVNAVIPGWTEALKLMPVGS